MTVVRAESVKLRPKKGGTFVYRKLLVNIDPGRMVILDPMLNQRSLKPLPLLLPNGKRL
jgi:hypothetical protein